MVSKELLFISQLSSYTLKASLTRLILVTATGCILLFLSSTLVDDTRLVIPAGGYIRVILTFLIISESNVLLDNLSERFLPIPEKIGLRITLHLIVSIIIAWLALIFFDQLIGIDIFKDRVVRLMVALGKIFVIITIIASIAIRITEKWINSLHELETLKQAKLQSDYNALQEQLNPHFLFNNLSVLKSMIIYDTPRAIGFIENFTDVYRYVLQCHDKTLVSLGEEFDYIKSYIGIHEERLGESLKVTYDINKLMLNKRLPALALQLLVENAIKHNIASQINPLNITIKTGHNVVEVTNNYQPKEAPYSTRQGLKNLEQRYLILTGKKISISKSGGQFKVELPLV